MIRGIYTAAAGLATAALRLGVASNNIANSNTNGYKQDRLPGEVGRPLDLMKLAIGSSGQPIGSVTLGPVSGLSQLDMTGGPLQESGGELDFALAGEASSFFAMRGADGTTRYTRDGSFHSDAQGQLVTHDGSPVLGSDGNTIQLPGGPVDALSDGTLLSNGVRFGQIQVVDFAPGTQLVKQGAGVFLAQDGTQPAPSTASHVYQGYTEGSNVNLTETMVQVMSLVRAYEANQKLMQAQDESLSRAVNDVGKVA